MFVPFPAPLTAKNVKRIGSPLSKMVLFCPPFVPFSKGSVKLTDEVHVFGKVQSGSLGMILHPYMVILVHRM